MSFKRSHHLMGYRVTLARPTSDVRKVPLSPMGLWGGWLLKWGLQRQGQRRPVTLIRAAALISRIRHIQAWTSPSEAALPRRLNW